MSREAIIFDMDGVLVDVSDSYRETIVRTVEFFTGGQVSRESIQDYKNAGGWNNDWALSQRIARDLGADVDYDTVVERFQRFFFGNGSDGLILRERWIAAPGLLEDLGGRFELGIFTGRLRDEAAVTLKRFASALSFHPIVTSDDVVNGKPDPEGLRRAQEALPGRRLWYVGDTVDDARSARAAGVRFIGIAGAHSPRRQELVGLLRCEGALAVLESINELEAALEVG